MSFDEPLREILLQTDDLEWVEKSLDGLSHKMLWRDPVTEASIALVRFEKGSGIPSEHKHASNQFMFCLSGHYELWETPPDELEARIADLRWPDYRGANITVPYKEDVLPLLDSVDAEATQIGAVNVIVNQTGMLVGYNTDAPGFMRALREEGKLDPSGCRALLLGAGGSARSVPRRSRGRQPIRTRCSTRRMWSGSRPIARTAGRASVPISHGRPGRFQRQPANTRAR